MQNISRSYAYKVVTMYTVSEWEGGGGGGGGGGAGGGAGRSLAV